MCWWFGYCSTDFVHALKHFKAFINISTVPVREIKVILFKLRAINASAARAANSDLEHTLKLYEIVADQMLIDPEFWNSEYMPLKS